MQASLYLYFTLPPPSYLCFVRMLWESCLDLAKPLIRGLYNRTAVSSVFLILAWMEVDGQTEH